MWKDTDTDLVPWILGGILIAAGAIAILAAKAPPVTPPPQVVAASRPVAAPTQTPRDQAPRDGMPGPAAAIHPAMRPALPAGQVWQCVVNGQRTFFDSPCGAGASVRQLNPVNRMDAAPLRPVWSYPAPDPSYPPPDAVYAPPAAEENPSDLVDNVYVTGQVNVNNAHRRRDHPPRQHRHDRENDTHVPSPMANVRR